ncbi:MAG: hypothetical protein ACTHWF_00305 [Brachybacterium sp.]|uniref:hypothetical protein n=1 Tax=Brachybacterium sp. Z12 TaxID=2759167 RepID=UPI00223A847C|nr:hypothetical protein [Brachybacterium sp. Z12]
MRELGFALASDAAGRHAGGMEDQQKAQQRERELVLSEYGTWRITADEDAPAVDEVRTLETLLRLKTEQLGSPDPGLWTEVLATDLLTEVVPRTVIQPREQVMDMVPTLTRFFAYLRETGRWHEESMSVSAAPAMLAGLEFAALEAADDPTRRSFSTNILGYGMSLGVDLEDEQELAAYMHWYNSLADEARVALSETGRPPEPAPLYDRLAALEAVREEPAEGSWPSFLPGPAGSADALRARDLEPQPQDYADLDFVRFAVALLDFLDTPRRVTATGALGRADTAALLDRCGIDRPVRSMWDHPEIVGPWVALRDGGWVDVVGGRARREHGPARFVTADGDPELFVEFGHAVLTALLLGRDARGAEDGGFRGMPDTAAALMAACGEDGLQMQDPLTADPTVLPDHEEVGRWMRVMHDLEDLVALGALGRDGDRFTGSEALLMALVALLRDRD